MHQLSAIQEERDVQGHDVVLMPRAPQASHHRPEQLSNSLYTCCDAQFTFATDPSLWQNLGSLTGWTRTAPRQRSAQPLYTAEEKRRRDATPWTLGQGILPPVQFFAFLVSLVLVLRYLATGDGLLIATCSVVIKT